MKKNLLFVKDTGGEGCTDSYSCGQGGFCNFEHDYYGSCETCDDYPDPETSCENIGVLNPKGVYECKRFCKG